MSPDTHAGESGDLVHFAVGEDFPEIRAAIRYRTLLDSPHVFAGILAVLALAVAFDALVQSIERRVAGWRVGAASLAGAAADRPVGSFQPTAS